MIVQCPECKTRFEVADELLPETGRKVRCGNCAHVWLQLPETDIFAPAEDDEDIDFKSAMQNSFNEKTDALQSKGDVRYIDEEIEYDGPIKSFFVSIIIWITALLKLISGRLKIFYHLLNSDGFTKFTGFLMGLTFFVVIFIYSFIGLREAITLRFPSFYNIYTYLGYEVQPAGKELVFVAVQTVWKHKDNGDPYLEVEGTIHNAGKEARHIPPVKFTTILASGTKGDSFIKEIEDPILEPDEKREFTFAFPSALPEKSNILVTFDVESLN